MPKRIAPLTDAKVRTVKVGKKPQKLFDGGGLFLLITPSGGKLWKFKYRFEGKEKKYAKYLPERSVMMQHRADYLDRLMNNEESEIGKKFAKAVSI